MKKDEDKTKEQLIGELIELRQQVAELEVSEAKRKRAEETLTRSRAEFEAIFNSISDAVIFADTRRCIVMVNPAFTTMFGYEPEETKGRTTQFLYESKADYVELGRKRYRVGIEWERHPFEIRYRRKDGSLFEAESLGVQVKDAQDKIIGFLGVHRDITERKRAEAELRKLSRAVEQSPSTVVITDVQGNIEYVNPRFTQITGYTAQEVSGKNPRLLKSGEHPSAFYAELWATILAGKVWRSEFINKKKSGELYWELASISPVRNAGGAITHFIKVAEDITERKQAEEGRERLILELQDTLAKVKTLSGLLPICASCKKIRDDEGYWNQLETYIQEHSEAEFSHGICPECAKKLYPEFFKDDR